MVQSASQPSTTYNKYDELIVVVPRAALEPALRDGLFTPQTSFSLIEKLITQHMTYIKRKDAEVDPTYKQIIPYFVFKQDNQYFLMQRANTAGESRLKNKMTLGIGGHIREEDVLKTPLEQWGMREFHEEVYFDGGISLSPLGIINDNRDAVGTVHLGLVFLVEGIGGTISVRSELKGGLMTPLSEIQEHYDALESWSQLVVDHLTKISFVQGARRMHTAITPDVVAILEARALGLRIDSARATTASKSGHPTSCFSAADLISALFFYTMRFDLTNPKNKKNDRFIMSKGHAIPIVYAAYKQLGVLSDEQLMTLRAVDSILEGHPTPRFVYNEAATGSLGQGLAIGIGMALQARLDKLAFKTFVMLGDGEIAEGSVWEAADFAGYNDLDNLIAIVDCNRLGQSDHTIAQHDTESVVRKFAAFGWHTITIDGHNISIILDALAEATTHKGKPVVIVAKTLKGYGLDSIQDKIGFHGKPFTDQELTAVIGALKTHFNKAAAQLSVLEDELNVITSVTVSPEHHAITIQLKHDSAHDQFALGKSLAPRKAYGYALAALGKEDKDVVVLDADVKNSTHSDIFEKEHPDRFIQCFIAEQNMVSIATGLISRGKIAFAATFGAFFTRAHDQIRMASIGRVPLRLCGTHCGVSIGEDGPSQMALEDIALMRAIPHSVVLYPSDATSAYALTGLMAGYNEGISFLRATRENLPILYSADEQFTIGGCKVLKQSSFDKACIITAGITLHEALKAHAQLAEEGINVAIIDLYSIKPLDAKTIAKVAQQAGGIILTVEDHYVEGGLGEAVRAALPGREFTVENLAVKELSRSGKPQELMDLAGISAIHIAAVVSNLLKKI
jgi:transketolase